MEFRENEVKINYPIDLIENMNMIPQNHVVPCSVLFGKKEIPGIFIFLSANEIEYFEIVSKSPPEPPLKFRMLDYEKRTFVIEIWMQFKQEPEKYLKMHLNPHDKQVQKLLELGTKTKMISFHFYDANSNSLSSAVTGLDDEEIDWFNRNYELSNKLSSDHIGYRSIVRYLQDNISETDRIFNYFNQVDFDFFVNENGKLIEFE